jgi:hypothetical protein
MNTGVTYIIPCSGSKAANATQARHLYTGAMFRHTLRTAEALAAGEVGRGRVLVLSARYGLVELDTVLASYDTRITSADRVSVDVVVAQALALGVGDDVYALLPSAYLELLDTALRNLDIYVQDVYEANLGIGEQRRINVLAA